MDYQVKMEESEETATDPPPLQQVQEDVAENSAEANLSEPYVVICEMENGEGVELPLESDGTLALATLQIEFTGALGLKFRNPASGLFRVLKPDEEGKLRPPPEGWQMTQFVACMPREPPKRSWMPTADDEEADGNAQEPPCKKVYVTPLTTTTSTVTFMRPTTPPLPPGPPPPQTQYSAPVIPRNGPVSSFPALRPNLTGANSVPVTFPAPGGQPKRAPVQYKYCDVCKISLNSESQAQLHFAGKRHTDKAAGNRNPGGVNIRGPSRGRTRGALLANGPQAVPPRGWTPIRFIAPTPQDFSTDGGYDFSSFTH